MPSATSGQSSAAHLGIDPFLDDVGQDRHEGDRHRQAIPEQTGVIRIPVVVGRAEAGQKHADEKHTRRQVAAKKPQAQRADPNERQVGNDVPKIRDAQQRLPVGKLVIVLRLRDRWKQQQAQQRRRRQTEHKRQRMITNPPDQPILPQ
jgi:hypothetical protein